VNIREIFHKAFGFCDLFHEEGDPSGSFTGDGIGFYRCKEREMPPQLEPYLAEFDETADLESHPAELKSGDAQMDFDVKAERAKSQAEMKRLLVQPGAQTIQEGVEAYRHELPTLLANRQAHKVIAYRGSKRLAIAETREALLERLKEKGISEATEGLYIKKIRPLDDPPENFHSGHGR